MKAIVTGSAKRTGRAIAVALADAGHDVAVHYNHSADAAEEVSSQIRKIGRGSIAVKADLTSYNETKSMMGQVAKEFGRIDILINNVGNFIFKDMDEYTVEEWHHLLDTTLNSTYHCCKAVLPIMREQKSGIIINMGDSQCDRIQSSVKVTPYMIGKTGCLILTQTLAKIEAKHGIRVNMVSPGVLENSVVKPKDDVPAGRWAKYEDITNAILFLLKEESDYITGANIKVSGGWRT